MDSPNADCEYFVQLSSKPIMFDPVSSNVSVFFDDANQHVFVVRSNGAGGIIVLDTNGRTLTYRIDDRGEIFAIRLSPALKVLTVQRAPNALDFLNCPDSKKENTPFCQTCKGKTTRIIDFFWASNTEIIFITDSGLEFYDVDIDKKSVKCTKTISIGHVNWSLWHMASKLLVISSGVYGNILFLFHYDNGTLTRYNKLDVELSSYPPEPKLTLLRRNVFMAKLYNHTYIITLKTDNRSSQASEVVLYKIGKERTITKTNILKLTSGGLYQLNIVDSLIVVHHLQSKTSFLYDIKFASVTNQQVSVHQQPLIAPLPLRQISQKPEFITDLPLVSVNTKNYEMYSSNWIIFQPDIIIDAHRGCLWRVELNLSAFPLMISDRCMLVEVLLHRSGAKTLILDVLKDMILPLANCTLSVIGETFNKINQVYAYNEDNNSEYEILTYMALPAPVDAMVIIQQDDVYTHVFCPVFCDGANNSPSRSFPVAVMMEYINSLQLFGLTIHFYLYELLVNTLVKCGDLYKLHQFLQYHVMVDSKHLACLLLSIQNVYPPAYQIALDMLKRLGTACDQIVEVFLSNNQVLTALRYVRSVGNVEQLQPRKFLSVAKDSGDPDVFYTIYKFFEDSNIRLRKTPSFAPNDHCEEYELYYRLLFTENTDTNS